MRALGNMTVLVPADPLETEQAVREAARMVGPVFLRVSRMPVPAVHGPDYVFQIGRASRLRAGSQGRDPDRERCAGRASTCRQPRPAQEGIDARVLNMASVRPIDRQAILEAAEETGAIVTAEEHTIYGGLGSAVAEVVVTAGGPCLWASWGSRGSLLRRGLCSGCWTSLA